VAAHAEEIRAHERLLVRRLHEGLLEVPGVTVLGPPPGQERAPVLSIVHERLSPDEMAFALDRRWGIAVRAGLHCSPWTHETVGTRASGAVRFGLGWSLTADDVDAALSAMRELTA
jgi:selenocysteine lyase/cysteine desulfurase